MFSPALLARTENILSNARAKGLRIATAESCTGGLLSALLTEIPGSSDVFERGFVTYSNEAKRQLLDVPQALIAKHGAVSAKVAGAMAQGALAHSSAHIAVSITGVAGPGGGSAQKPVGLVWFGLSYLASPSPFRGEGWVGDHNSEHHPLPNISSFKEEEYGYTTHSQCFSGDRHAVRMQAVEYALGLLSNLI